MGIVENMKTGVLNIPAPLLTVVFQKFGNGMHAYTEALRLVRVELPFPYTAATRILLVLLTSLTPYVFCSWTSSRVWPVVFAFAFVFTFWTLNFTAEDPENPFGDHDNNLNMRKCQCDLNTRLVALLSESNDRIPNMCVPLEVAEFRTMPLITQSARASLAVAMQEPPHRRKNHRIITRIPAYRRAVSGRRSRASDSTSCSEATSRGLEQPCPSVRVASHEASAENEEGCLRPGMGSQEFWEVEGGDEFSRQVTDVNVTVYSDDRQNMEMEAEISL